ncbi:MerR family transcriptional regulator [Virgibacillus sp. NKC19-3]|uniref:MerR family transcriptional regulator n=1 Tax=Virgibacillus saliphilus TaxID=2831674 RepID=UPI001C9B80CA|nr:MerR family transcriptional regulator [Virgibacillus sp. NKC19-3]MBY7141874.1 MerR family transcriptional regulator [Virgibacillus sp. NKC19-3]
MYSIGQLSKKTGVTVRTLDYYDEIGLITPSSSTEGGHRLYDDDDVLRLEQILALKYIGFSLQQVQEVLEQSTASWEQSLEQQLKMIQQQQKHLKELERAVQGVLYSIRFEEEVRWPVIFDMIHMFQQDTDATRRLFENYFNPDEHEAIKDVGTQMNENDFREWQKIIHAVRANIHVDASSETAQQLARQWMDKVDAMFSGDEVLEAKMWKAIKDHSGEITFYPMDEEVVSFIDRAVTIMHKRERNKKDNENHKRGKQNE